MRPIIIGAGPVGSYIAKHINKLNPLLIERKKKIGVPIQCTGLVSTKLQKLTSYPNRIILNKIKGATFFSKHNKITLNTNKIMAHVLDRTAYDKWMFNQYKGEKKLGEEFIKYNNGIVKTRKKTYKTNLVIDCSGPKYGLLGIQAVTKLKRETSLVEVHFNIVPDFFAWVVPVNKTICRVGLATSLPNPKRLLDSFLSKINAGKVLEWNAGLIPLVVNNFIEDNLIRVGDSAGQVKAISGGGLVTGISSARIATNAIKLAYLNNNFSRSFFRKYYYNIWKKTIGNELKTHLLVRQYLNSLNPEEYDDLINFIKKNKETFIKEGDMDYPKKLIIKLLRPKNMFFFIKAFIKLLTLH